MMMVEIEDLTESQFKALREIGKEKIKAAKAYNKKICEKSCRMENDFTIRFTGCQV